MSEFETHVHEGPEPGTGRILRVFYKIHKALLEPGKVPEVLETTGMPMSSDLFTSLASSPPPIEGAKIES